MPGQINIVHTHKFISATPEGVLDLEETKNIFMGISLASAALQNYNIIFDARNTKSVMSVFDLWYLSAELYTYNVAFSQKTAILYTPEQFDNAEFFAICSQNRGYKVETFTSYEDTLAWFLE